MQSSRYYSGQVLTASNNDSKVLGFFYLGLSGASVERNRSSWSRCLFTEKEETQQRTIDL